MSSQDEESDTLRTAILYRDQKTGTAMIHRFDPRQIDDDDIQNFFKLYKCYDILHQNTKMVSLDTRVRLKKALHAMMEQGVRACPLWSSSEGRYVGMLTITDFIRILQKNYAGPDIPMEAFERETLADWQETINSKRKFIHLTLDSGLIEACRMLIENRIHRLPVIDPETGDLFAILNQKPLLKFLFNIPKVRTLTGLGESIEEAGVGSYDNISTANKDTKVIEALNRLVNERVAALPIVDEDGRLINIFSKFDVFNLESFADLETSLEEVTKLRMFFDGVYSCKGSDTVLACIEKLVTANVNRLVIVSEEDRVAGIVTVSDMIDFLVLRNCTESSPSRRNTRARTRTVSVSEAEGSPVTRKVTVKRNKSVSECEDVMKNLDLDEHKVVIFNRLKSIAEVDPNGHVTVISVKPSQTSYCDSENTGADSLGESEEPSWSEDTPPASEHPESSPPPPTWFSV